MKSVNKIIVILFIAFSCVFTVNGQSAQELYKKANDAYKANQFQQAADDYEKIVSQGHKSSDVYYNLGNCYYKLNIISKSILNYERALKLSPKDDDIIHNLKITQLKAVDRIQPVPQLSVIIWWNNFISSYSSKGWGIYALIFVWVALICYVVAYFIGVRKLFHSLMLVFLVLSLSSLALSIHQKNNEQSSDSAILMVSSSYIKSAPDAGANDLFLIHEGIKFQLLDKIGEWSKIRLADGKIGWVENNNFTVI